MNGLMIESHFDPSVALSDAEQQLTPKQLGELISKLILRKEVCTEDAVNKLSELRNIIDEIDEELIHVLKKRTQIIEQIGNYKKEHNITIFQLERWQELLRTRIQLAQKLGLSPNHVEKICQLLHEESIRIQNGLMNK
jgi:chorismate mutase